MIAAFETTAENESAKRQAPSAKRCGSLSFPLPAVKLPVRTGGACFGRRSWDGLMLWRLIPIIGCFF